mgnify:CR=1 FL=1
MKQVITIAAVAIFAVLVSTSGIALADTDAPNYFPTKIQLTVEQQKLVQSARDQGRNQLVLPLTFNQEDYLEAAWAGWHGGMITVYTADCHELLGEAMVVPE